MPHELASTPQEVDAIEFLQLCAFEAGEGFSCRIGFRQGF